MNDQPFRPHTGPWAGPRETAELIEDVEANAVAFVSGCLKAVHFHNEAQIYADAEKLGLPNASLIETDQFYILAASVAKLGAPQPVPGQSVEKDLSSLFSSFSPLFSSRESNAPVTFPVVDRVQIQVIVKQLGYAQAMNKALALSLSDRYDICIEIVNAAGRIKSLFADPGLLRPLSQPFILADEKKVSKGGTLVLKELLEKLGRLEALQSKFPASRMPRHTMPSPWQ